MGNRLSGFGPFHGLSGFTHQQAQLQPCEASEPQRVETRGTPAALNMQPFLILDRVQVPPPSPPPPGQIIPISHPNQRRRKIRRLRRRQNIRQAARLISRPLVSRVVISGIREEICDAVERTRQRKAEFLNDEQSPVPTLDLIAGLNSQ